MRLREPTSPDNLAQCAKNEPLKVWEIWTSFSGAIEKENLLFEDQISGYHGLYSSRFDHANDDSEKSIDNCSNTRISRILSVID